MRDKQRFGEQTEAGELQDDLWCVSVQGCACFYIGNISLPTKGSVGLNKADRGSLLLVLQRCIH